MSDLQQAINRHVHKPAPEEAPSFGYQEAVVTEQVTSTAPVGDLARAVAQHINTAAPDAPVAAPPQRMGWMKARILKFGLGLLGQKLDGYKAKSAGVAFMILGLVGYIGIMFPDQGLPEMTVVEASGYFVGGWGLFGGADKGDKIIRALQGAKGGE